MRKTHYPESISVVNPFSNKEYGFHRTVECFDWGLHFTFRVYLNLNLHKVENS